MSSTSVGLSLVLVADAFRDTVYQNATDGAGETIARWHLRSESFRFITQLAFFVVAISFVTSPVPAPLPQGTIERVGLFTLGAAVILVQSIDSYGTKRSLLRQ